MKKNIHVIIVTTLFVIAACSSPTDSDSKKNNNGPKATVSGSSHYWQTENTLFRIGACNFPGIYFDKYDEEKTYELELVGIHLGNTYTLDIEFVNTDTISNDSVSAAMSVDYDGLDMKTDYYEAKLKEVDSEKSFDVMHNGKRAHFYDTDATDLFALIQVENSSYTPRDSIISDQDTRVRPYPNLLSYSGKLHFYNKNYVDQTSVSINGANGSRNSAGVVSYYSLSISKATMGALVLNSGEYFVRFENSDASLVSPFVKVNFVKK